MAAEWVLWIRNGQFLNLTATRDLLRVRYFLEIQCPEILREKIKEEEVPEESFFVVDSKRWRAISKQQFQQGVESAREATLIQLSYVVPAKTSLYRILPVRLRLVSPSHLRQEKRRTYEVHGMVSLF